MLFSKNIDFFSHDYKKLFIVDGIGALISSLFLGIVLVNFQEYIGIPVSSLYVLAAIPILFILYDIYCYMQLNDTKAAFHLRLIAIANLWYILVSIGFAVYHFPLLRPLGFIYLLGEIIVIFCIAFIQLEVAKKIC